MDEYEKLIDKIIEIRNQLSDEENEYYSTICSPEYVLEAVIDKYKGQGLYEKKKGE